MFPFTLFVFQTEELNKEVISSGEQLQSGQTRVIELRHTVQALEIDLQAQTSTVCNTQSIHNISGMSENELTGIYDTAL